MLLSPVMWLSHALLCCHVTVTCSSLMLFLSATRARSGTTILSRMKATSTGYPRSTASLPSLNSSSTTSQMEEVCYNGLVYACVICKLHTYVCMHYLLLCTHPPTFWSDSNHPPPPPPSPSFCRFGDSSTEAPQTACAQPTLPVVHV